MSDEFELAADLAAFEARIAATPLPASSIDRDSLFYRAGWSAAQAVTQPTTSRTHIGWPALCACLAALLLVVVSLNVRSDHSSNEGTTAGNAVSSSTTTLRRDVGDQVPTSLLQLRNELVQMEVSSPTATVQRIIPDIVRPSPITSRRELLDELLSNNS